ncbi:hypothetical protein GS399_18525 [Pedobacter sp. HMF7647]|uniref:Tetratricopeptide repeat protein n=1 Tax=Hufsiella arboris TaxID=2695275 RepID=A0A7K1YF02_9SPHI|nr:hypothetical protein [Hufsiella arboris]MXV52971.1 hypothetical protein [Hufsiella arboris]
MRITLLLIFLITTAFSKDEDLPSIRKQYYEAVNNADAAHRFYDMIAAQKSEDPVILAYFGSAQALKARYSWNPYNKMAYLKRGISTLATAVSKSPDNLEIRFLRFSLEHYVPSFLGFSRDLDPDRRKIVELIEKKQFGSMDKDLLKNMVKFMEESKRCTPKELETMRNAMK